MYGRYLSQGNIEQRLARQQLAAVEGHRVDGRRRLEAPPALPARLGTAQLRRRRRAVL